MALFSYTFFLTNNRIIEITPNGYIDKELTYDEYIENEKVAATREALLV